MAILLSLSACDKFPAKNVFIRGANECVQLDIVKENPLEFGNKKIIAMQDCPIVYGFKEDDVGYVTDWIRRNQKKGK